MGPESKISRRAALAAAAAVSASPAVAMTCQVGPPPHQKGPIVWMGMDQIELDAAYAQSYYTPLVPRIRERWRANNEAVRHLIGEPLRVSYGPTDIEKLDIYRTNKPNAPIFIYIHGGQWRYEDATENSASAEMFFHAGAHYVSPDFISVDKAGGDLQVMADQVRKAIAWVFKNARSFSGDPDRLYVGGHSSGGHLCGVALVTDWQKEFGLPPDFIKGGLCMSGLYDMKPVRLSKRGNFVHFTDEMEDSMSSRRHIGLLRAPIIVSYGNDETPEFQRQNRDFAAAVKAAGKPVQLIEAMGYNHFEMAESLADPYGPNGRAALELMSLSV